MSIYELLSSNDDFLIESEILMREFELDIDIINDEYMMETELSILESIYTESDEEAYDDEQESKGFIGFISNLINRFIKMLGDFFTMIKDGILGPSKNLKPEEYFEDPSVQVKLKHDVDELHRVAEEEKLKGRKFVQAIANKTNIDDHVIADWIDSSARKLSNVKGIVMTVGTMFGSRFIYNKLFAKKTDEMKKIEKMAKDKKLNKKQREQYKKVVNHMIAINKAELDAEKDYYKQMNACAKIKYKAKKLWNTATEITDRYNKYNK